MNYENMQNLEFTIRQPKKVASIKICGAITIDIYDDNIDFTIPTKEQIKNLHDILCIDVELFE